MTRNSRIILPYPHRGQRTVLRGKRRRNWVACGRRWRKTTMCMADTVEQAALGAQAVWGAPTYDQVFTAFEEARKAVAGYARPNTSRMEITFPGGGRIIYRSLDNPDNARGKTADIVVVDEAADVAEIAWTDVLQPMLLDTGGYAWIIGTPKRRNWFWQGHVSASDDPDAVAWQAPTRGLVRGPDGWEHDPHPLENEDIPVADVLRMVASMPERTVRQEILAEFLDDTGGVFRYVAEQSTEEASAPRPGTFVAGLDFGRSVDYTVISIMDAQTLREVFLDRFNGTDWGVQRARIQGALERWDVTTAMAEANSFGGPNIEELRNAGLPVQPFTTTNASKREIVENMVLQLENRAIHLLNDPIATSEMQAFEMTQLPSGMVRYAAPDGLHDDTVIARCLAAWACTRPRRTLEIL